MGGVTVGAETTKGAIETLRHVADGVHAAKLVYNTTNVATEIDDVVEEFTARDRVQAGLRSNRDVRSCTRNRDCMGGNDCVIL